ncbi:hypothetical protein HDV05_006433 [Chytridiales sp. JEL 0842]|nr:hypothetical protein HDV05_006433 [Chytridiales sp. JEL 0842]
MPPRPRKQAKTSHPAEDKHRVVPATGSDNPFADLAELSSVGGKILFATDDFFAVAENLIVKADPVWDEKKFTQFGKWMDGWETRRKRVEGHDWCILKLGLGGIIQGIDADTAFFTGNQTPRISIQAACLDKDLPLVRRSEMGTKCTEEELKKALDVGSDKWEEILPMVPLLPGYPDKRHNFFKVFSEKKWTHLRVNYFPDGGVARLRVYGEVVKDWSKVQEGTVVDFLAMENGGKPTGCSNAHYGKPFNMISPGKSEGMYDGWETARNPNRPPIFEKGPDGHLIMPGYEWSAFKLGAPGVLEKAANWDDTKKKDVPDSAWFTLVPRTKLTSDAPHDLEVPADARKVCTHLKITIYPDGGVARIRAFGKWKAV